MYKVLHILIYLPLVLYIEVRAADNLLLSPTRIVAINDLDTIESGFVLQFEFPEALSTKHVDRAWLTFKPSIIGSHGETVSANVYCRVARQNPQNAVLNGWLSSSDTTNWIIGSNRMIWSPDEPEINSVRVDITSIVAEWLLDSTQVAALVLSKQLDVSIDLDAFNALVTIYYSEPAPVTRE